jgi:hypothetical protein
LLTAKKIIAALGKLAIPSGGNTAIAESSIGLAPSNGLILEQVKNFFFN